MIPHVSHVEWHVSDVDRSATFFSELFGWRFERFSRHYRLYAPANGVRVGLMEVSEVPRCEAAQAHVQVGNIDTCLKRAGRLGGREVTPRTEIPDYGWYAHIADPDGNLVGLFQAMQPLS